MGQQKLQNDYQMHFKVPKCGGGRQEPDIFSFIGRTMKTDFSLLLNSFDLCYRGASPLQDAATTGLHVGSMWITPTIQGLLVGYLTAVDGCPSKIHCIIYFCELPVTSCRCDAVLWQENLQMQVRLIKKCSLHPGHTQVTSMWNIMGLLCCIYCWREVWPAVMNVLWVLIVWGREDMFPTWPILRCLFNDHSSLQIVRFKWWEHVKTKTIIKLLLIACLV